MISGARYSNDQQSTIFLEGPNCFVPAENNGTPEWWELQAWIDEGNTIAPYDPPIVSNPKWKDLYNAILVSPAFQYARSIARINLAVNVSYTDLASSLALAAAGQPNAAAIAAGYANLKNDLEAIDSPFSSDHQEGLNLLFTTYYIDMEA